MKSIFYILPILIFFSSCSLSKDVNNGRLIQKRKYTKGFHIGSKVKKLRLAVERNKSEPLVVLKRVPLIQEISIAESEGNMQLSNESALIHQNTVKNSLIKEIRKENKVNTNEQTDHTSIDDISGKSTLSTAEIYKEQKPTSLGKDRLSYVFLSILAFLFLPVLGAFVGPYYLKKQECSKSDIGKNVLLTVLSVLSIIIALVAASSSATGMFITISSVTYGALIFGGLFMVLSLVQGMRALKKMHLAKEVQ